MSEEFGELLGSAVAGEEFADSWESPEHGDEGYGGEDHADESESPWGLPGEEKVVKLCEQRVLF